MQTVENFLDIFKAKLMNRIYHKKTETLEETYTHLAEEINETYNEDEKKRSLQHLNTAYQKIHEEVFGSNHCK